LCSSELHREKLIVVKSSEGKNKEKEQEREFLRSDASLCQTVASVQKRWGGREFEGGTISLIWA